MLRRFFQGLHAFGRFKSLSEQWTIQQLPYVGDSSLNCVSNVDRNIMTRTHKKRNEVLLKGGSSCTSKSVIFTLFSMCTLLSALVCLSVRITCVLLFFIISSKIVIALNS